MDTNTLNNGGYEAPKVETLGTVTDLTLHNTHGHKTDAAFISGTPFDQVEFS